MAGKISDVKVGLPSRKMSLHRKDTPSSFTLNFGEVSPLCCFEMDGKTKIRGSVASIVRMPPLPRPVFGELAYKQYARFVPMKEVFRNFENLRGARSLTTQFGTFTPSAVPYITVRALSGLLLSNFCKFNIYVSDKAPISALGGYNESQTFDDLKLLNSYNSGDLTPFITKFNAYYNTSLSLSGVWYGAQDEHLDDSTAINFDNCDFFVSQNTETGATKTVVFCFRLTRLGRVLKRIFDTLQYGFDLDNDRKVSILPLIAFYKAYFDLFVPANTATGNRNYTDTNAFRLSDFVCEHDIQNVVADSTSGGLFNSLLTDLSNCFYYQDPDFITSAIASPSIAPATAPRLSSPISLGDANRSAGSMPNQLPLILRGAATTSVQSGWADAWNIKLLLRLLPYVNKDTIIGGRLRQLIKARFGYDIETLEGVSYTAGKFDLPIDISAITNASDTQVADNGSPLGWQGGVGVGYNKRDTKGNLEALHFNFKADEPGYFFILGVIVPKCGFFQGLAPYLSNGTDGRFSIYDSAFDSLGFDIVTKDILVGTRYARIAPFKGSGSRPSFEALNLGNTGFGYVPRYFRYKTQPLGIKGGDLVRAPYRKLYSAYYLDKLISTDIDSVELDYTEPTESGQVGSYDLTIYNNTKSIPTATPDLRRIGFDEWLENLNRIFYQSGLKEKSNVPVNTSASWINQFGVDDNFICDNLIKASYFDHSKPSSESFETDGEGVSFAIDHA